MLEYNRTENPLRESLLTTPIEMSEGCLPIPTGPGLGVDVDEERLAFYSVS